MQLTIRGHEMYVHTTGPSNAPPILFIHGFPLSHELWSHACTALSDRYLCLAPDLRGHGKTPAAGETCSIAEYAADLAALLESMSPGQPTVIAGLSMGGTIALEMFRSHKAKVRALALVCCRSAAETEQGAIARRALIESVRAKGAIAAADAMLEKLLPPDAPDSLRHTWHGIMRSTSRDGVLAAAHALLTRPELTPLLPTIDVPTLVASGDRDQITPIDGMLAMHRAIPGSAFACVPGAGHLAPVEQPPVFNVVLRSFLDHIL